MKRKSSKEQPKKVVYRPVRCSVELDETIGQIAERKRISKSDVMRDLIYKGLEATGATIEEGYLYDLVRKCVAEELSPAVERLASICAKTTQISSAAFFMSIWGAARDGSPEDQQAIMEAAAGARRLGIEYLKLVKDRDLDAFIKEGAKQIMDE